jgi:hypothetical protein
MPAEYYRFAQRLGVLLLLSLLQGELMVATNLFAVYGKPATMSRITLAFMQDTGWYDVNWDSAGARQQPSAYSRDAVVWCAAMLQLQAHGI